MDFFLIELFWVKTTCPILSSYPGKDPGTADLQVGLLFERLKKVSQGVDYTPAKYHLTRLIQGDSAAGYTSADQLIKAGKMHDSTIMKVESATSPKGVMGQKYLASGKTVSMRLWEKEESNGNKPVTERDYETVGFVIEGKAELELEGQTIILKSGDSWLVPKGASHRYKIIEPFTAVEATSPPAVVHGRDDLQDS